jgi:hypothetical protein
MRFAGTRIEGFLGDKPDYGKIATGASTLRSKESQAATNLMGQTAAAGISAAGQVKGAKITGAAQSALAQAQGNAAVMGAIGQIGGAAIGAIPTGGGAGKIATLDSTPMTVEKSYGSSVSYYDPNIYTGVGDFSSGYEFSPNSSWMTGR